MQKPPQMGCLVGMHGVVAPEFEDIIWIYFLDEQFSWVNAV